MNTRSSLLRLEIVRQCFGLTLILMLYGCSSDSYSNVDFTKRNQTYFELIDPSDSHVKFINRVKDEPHFNVLNYRNYYNGGGVAIGDVNNDGLPDLYFTSNKEANILYLNRGDFKFEDIAMVANVEGSRGWSTGVTMVDINADGWLDIYVSNSGGINGENRENELFINSGMPKDGLVSFTESAAEYGLNNAGYSTQACFFDYDGDGDLDCYLLNNSFKDPKKIDLFKSMRDVPDPAGGDKLYQNNLINPNGESGIKFTDVSKTAGIYSSAIGFGLGASIGDINNDNLPDIYVSNDFWERDYLYINQGDGTFSEELKERLDFCSISSMGGDIGDINNDGFPEIVSTDMLPADNYRIQSATAFDPYHLENTKYRANYYYQIGQNCLHLNDGNGDFQEIAMLSGVGATDWSWGALLFDFENDGLKDLFVSNGTQRDLMNMDFRDDLSQHNTSPSARKSKLDLTEFTAQMPESPLPNFAFSNRGNLKFKNQSTQLGLDKASFSNGSAYADLDNDGDMDLVVNNVNNIADIYENKAEKTGNNYLKIEFQGPSGNVYGVGAKVEIRTSNEKQMVENYSSRGFQSSIEPIVIVGLGDNDKVDDLKVTWPDGHTETIKDVAANQTITIAHSNSKYIPAIEKSSGSVLFTDVTDEKLIGNSKHNEDVYNDFDHELLLLHMLSTEGPQIINGDVNGDGLEDFILCGAKNDEDKLFIQSTAGKFHRKTLKDFQRSKAFETTAGVLFDTDGDGDLDLVLASGGNITTQDKQFYILRYYENDGNGNFSINVKNTPRGLGNFSCIEVADIDNDGDDDMFVGGRAIPGNYGLTPQSFLFRNDNGSWTDITTEQLRGVGMVTDATWADINGDNYLDLVVVGDWMGIKIFSNQNGQLRLDRELDNSKGMWNRIVAADLDNDGDQDFVIGNRGLNSKLSVSADRPLTLNVNDFDNNGKSEFIINWYPPMDNQSYPFASKLELTQQLPALRKQLLKYNDYATATYTTIFDQPIRDKATNFIIDNLSSVVVWNNEGHLDIQALPIEAQVAPVYGIAITDYDRDGISDIWLGGNLYELKPQIGRHDASRGLILKGTKEKSFVSVDSRMSGLNIDGQVRDAKIIKSSSDQFVLISRNDDSPVLLKIDN